MYYPRVNPNIILSEQSVIAIDIISGKHISLPKGAFPILKLTDGKTDIDTIIRELSCSYNIEAKEIYNFYYNLKELGFIFLETRPNVTLQCEDKFPIRIASIELTEKCNLKCRYCYGAFSPTKAASLSLEEAENLFDALQKRHVRIIELTGGEPTVNPYFNEILRSACERFMTVTVMTNASAIPSTSYEIFKTYKDKIGFSISIDGFSESSNAFQRGVRNTFSKTLYNIIKIKKEIDPKFFRVVYMLTNENEKEADAFFDYMLDNNVLDIMVSIPENIEKGRTYKLSDGCTMSDRCSAIRMELDKRVLQIGEKYMGRVRTVSDRLGQSGMKLANVIPSCGAGWTMLSFQSNGDVMPCNMIESKWKLGNFREDPNLNFLSLKNPLYSLFANINLSAENDNRKECENCFYNKFCGKCITRILIANKDRIQKNEEICPVLKRTGILSCNVSLIEK